MRPEKQFLVDELQSYFSRTDYVIFVTYTGLTVAETEDLRQRLDKHQAEFHVIKNRLFRRAAEAEGITALEELLLGQNAVVFGGPAIADVIKALEKFTKEKNKLEIKGGIIGKTVTDPKGVGKMKDMPPLPVLQAQLLGLLNKPASELVGYLNQPGQQFVNVLNAVPSNILSVLQQRSQQQD